MVSSGYNWKSWETYSALTVEAPVIVRLDGNDFHNITKSAGFKIPFDERFHQVMVNTAIDLMVRTGFQIFLTHTSSDEISLLFMKSSHIPHSERLEKILSLLSAYATSSFQHQIAESLKENILISFDSRIIKVNNLKDVSEYFTWRVSASFRNFLNAYAHYYIDRKRREGLKGKELISTLASKGFKIEDAPDWQKYGTILYWENVEKTAFNRKKMEKVKVYRRRLNRSTINLLNSTGRERLEEIIRNI